MVVGCPKCKAKLKIPDEKIKPEGTKFKCPKCQAMLLVKLPPEKKAPSSAPSGTKAPSFTEREPWPDIPPEPSSLGPKEPWPDATGSQPERESWPDISEPSAPPPPPFEEEPEPSAPPPPPFEEKPEPSAPPPPPFEEEPEPSAPLPPPIEEEPEPSAPPPTTFEEEVRASATMDTLTGAPPIAPPESEAKREEPSAEAPVIGPETKKVLLALPDAQMVNMLKFVLSGANFAVSSATDGVQAMVKALKELPDVVVADVRLSKIHGIEMMKRLRARAETENAKVILTGSKPDNEVPPIHGASGYIQQDRMQQGLVDIIKKALAEPEAAPEATPSAHKPGATVPKKALSGDAGVQRAERFARTVLSDIELYNKAKVDESIRQGNFESAFAKELEEGRKLYEMRIPADIRSKGNFYAEAVQTFLQKKKQQLGI